MSDWDELKRQGVVQISQQINSQKHEIARLRAALINAGRAAGAQMTDDVSTDFLMHVPDEIESRLSKPLSNAQSAPSQLGTVERYLIWSNQHRAWWRANSAGYTVYVTAAGIYSKEEALDVSWKGRDGWESEQKCPAEIAVPLSSIPERYRPTE